jgi:glycosyltransferase involved in cell wall biosynthesis
VVTLLDGVRAPAPSAPPGAVRRELGIPEGAFVVGSVGRLARQKRYDRLLRTVASLPGEVHCLIAGEGDERGPLTALAAELGIAGRVHLAGFRADVGDVLAALDVFVLSSDREGFANAMLEAMAAGLPVVSTDVSGAREALEPGPGEPAVGIVVPRDEAALAAAIGRLAADPAGRRAMGAAAHVRAERHFGEERFLDDWERLLTRRDG